MAFPNDNSLRGQKLSDYSRRGQRLSDRSLRGRSSQHLRLPRGLKVKRSQFLRVLFLISAFWLVYFNHEVMEHSAITSKDTRKALTVGDAPWMTENITVGEAMGLNSKRAKRKAVTLDFDWDDVDLTKKGNCGWHKCFWRSVSNQTLGYLIAEERQYRQMQIAVDVALDLEKNFNSKHFHLDLVVVNVTEEFKDQLNSLVDQPARRSRGLKMQGIYKSQQLIIEKVLIAPDPALFFGSAKANRQLTEDQLPKFRSKISDKEAFRNQVKAEHKRLVEVFKHNPLLALDFQAVIDPAGHLYHIDLDGHLSMAKRENNTELRIIECLTFLEEVNDHLTKPEKKKRKKKSD